MPAASTTVTAAVKTAIKKAVDEATKEMQDKMDEKFAELKELIGNKRDRDESTVKETKERNRVIAEEVMLSAGNDHISFCPVAKSNTLQNWSDTGKGYLLRLSAFKAKAETREKVEQLEEDLKKLILRYKALASTIQLVKLAESDPIEGGLTIEEINQIRAFGIDCCVFTTITTKSLFSDKILLTKEANKRYNALTYGKGGGLCKAITFSSVGEHLDEYVEAQKNARAKSKSFPNPKGKKGEKKESDSDSE